MNPLLYSRSRNFVKPMTFPSLLISAPSKGLIKDGLAALASDSSDEATLADKEESYVAKKAELEKSLGVSLEKVADTERRVQEFEHNNDTLEDLPSEFGDAEAKLRSSEERVRFLEDKVSEDIKQLLEKDSSLNSYRERVFVTEQELASVSGGFKRLTAQHRSDKYLLDGVRTALPLHKTASQQRALAHYKDCDKLLADKAVLKTEFFNFRADMQAKINRSHISADGEVVRTNAIIGERIRLPVSEKTPRHRLQMRSGGSQDVEDLKYLLNGAVAKECCSQTITQSLQEQFLSVCSDVNTYRQRLPLYTERFTPDKTESFSGFLHNLNIGVKKLVEKQRNDIETNPKTALNTIDAFLRSVESKLSRLGPISEYF